MLAQRFLSLFVVAGLLFSGLVFAQILPQETKKDPFGEFLELKDQLKRAVCDEGFISKAPTLETEGKDQETREFGVWLTSKVKEHELISFLLGDLVQGMFSPQLKRKLKKTKLSFSDKQRMIHDLKRRTSLKFCEALVSQSKLKALFSETPSLFLLATNWTTNTSKKKGYWFKVVDFDNRFGKVTGQDQYLVPGWLEPFEVVELRAGKKIYRRVYHPLTNETQSIEVATLGGVSLGILYVSQEPSSKNWESYIDWAKTDAARNRQISTYRQLIEAEALQLVQRGNKNIKEIRKLQEYYKGVLKTYKAYPNEKQFKQYKKKAKSLSFSKVTKKILGKSFLSHLTKARVNGSYVQFGLFKPDVVLHAVYSEYIERLRKI